MTRVAIVATEGALDLETAGVHLFPAPQRADQAMTASELFAHESITPREPSPQSSISLSAIRALLGELL